MCDFFRVRKLTLTDHSVLYEIITPTNERVASASDPVHGHYDMLNLADMLNAELTKASQSRPDIVVNA